jgi:hypothetical protein
MLNLTIKKPLKFLLFCILNIWICFYTIAIRATSTTIDTQQHQPNINEPTISKQDDPTKNNNAATTTESQNTVSMDQFFKNSTFEDLAPQPTYKIFNNDN